MREHASDSTTPRPIRPPVRPSLRLATTAVLGLVTMLVAAPRAARADDVISVKGTTLRGKVVGITSTDVVMETVYGKGNITVPLADVESISTESRFKILHGDDETTGRVLGVRDGNLIVGESEATAVVVAPASVNLARNAVDIDESPVGGVRSALGLWRPSFDLGFNLQNATTNTAAFSIGGEAERKKAPTRYYLNARYRIGTQNKQGERQTTTQDDLRGGARGEYELTPSWYLWGSGDGTYDGIQKLSYRIVPKAGVGYWLWRSKEFELGLEGGGSWVDERYFGGDTTNYVAVAFGEQLLWNLPWAGSIFKWRTDYLPAVDNFTTDYLLRSEASFEVPMTDFVSFHTSFLDEYDSTPAEDTKSNLLTWTVGLRLGL